MLPDAPYCFQAGTAAMLVVVISFLSFGIFVSPVTAQEPAVLFEEEAVTVTEGGTSTYTVKLATQPNGYVTVTPKSDDETVAIVSGAVSLNSINWNQGATVTVTGVEDDDGATGMTSVSHKIEGYHDVTSAKSLPVTVADDDAALTLTHTLVIVYEGLTAIPVLRNQTYKVSLAAEPAGPVTVIPESRDKARVTVSGPLTFNTENWATGQEVVLTGVLDEDGYDHQVVIDHSVTGYDAPPVTVQTSVKDYHGKTLVVRPRNLTLAEGKTGIYSVKLRTNPLGTVTVTPAVEDESAATVSGTMTFDSSNWSIEQFAAVTAKAEHKNTTILNSVSGYSGYTEAHPGAYYRFGNSAPAVSTVAVTVTNEKPGLSLSRAGVIVSEAAGSRTTFRVSLASRPTGTVTISLVPDDPSVATVQPSELTFTPEEYVPGGAFRGGGKTVTVTGVDDNLVNDPDRTTMITLSASGGGYDSVSTKMQVTVTDDDIPGVVVSKGKIGIIEGGSPGTYTLKLTTQPDGPVAVTLTSDSPAKTSFFVFDQGNSYSDYDLATFNQDNWNQPKTVRIWGLDDDDDDNESVTISHKVTGYGDVTSADSVLITITDDDQTSEFSIGDSSVTEGDSGSVALRFIVTLSPAAGTNTTVDWTTSKEEADTATPGTDYRAASGTLSFAKGETLKIVPVDVYGDLISEVDETLTLTLGNASGGLVIRDATATGTIEDDDDAPSGTIGLGLSPTVVDEDAEATTVTVTATMPGSTTRSEATTLTVQVGDPSDTATEGTDYATVGAVTLTIAAGASTGTATFTIDPTQDTIDEGTGETVSVSGSTTAIGLSVSGTSLTIEDDDDAPSGTIGLGLILTVTPDNISEAGGTAEIMISTKDEVIFQTDIIIELELGGTATKSMDYQYTNNMKTLILKAGETFVSTEVVSMQDRIVEGNETVMISASHNGAEINFSTGARALMIMDDDSMSAVVSPTSLTVTESDDATTGKRENEATYTIVLTAEPTDDVTVSIQSSDEDVATVEPTNLEFTGENWNQPQTVTVSGVADSHDNIGDKRETKIMHAVSGGNYTGITADPVSVQVIDVSVGMFHQTWLTRFGRTVAEQNIAAVRDRIVVSRAPGFEARIGGQPLQRTGTADDPKNDYAPNVSPKAGSLPDSQISMSGLPFELSDEKFSEFCPFLKDDECRDEAKIRALSADDVLLESSFALARDTGAGSFHGFWGQATRSSFSGRDKKAVVNGEVTGVMIGTDWRHKETLFGAVLSKNQGKGTLDESSLIGIDVKLTSLVTWAGLEVEQNLLIWGAVGSGRGDVTVTPSDGDISVAEIGWSMLAAGATGTVPGDKILGVETRWHADALMTRTTSDSATGLWSTSGETTRLRLGVSVDWQRKLASGSMLIPHLETGLRLDGGDAETGFGLEIGGGIELFNSERGFSISLDGRTLALHKDGDFRNWGLSLDFLWDPYPETLRGWSLSAKQSLGGSPSGGVDSLLDPEAFPDLSRTEGEWDWSLEASYGTERGRGMVSSPYGSANGSESVEGLRLGWRIKPDTVLGNYASLDVWVQFSTDSVDHEPGMGLQWQWRW